jgi:dihydropteroate synthase
MKMKTEVSSLFLKLNQRLYDLRTPIIMGIVNVTPDSFFSLSRFKSGRSLLNQVEHQIADGAAIIDVGGYSTRPDAEAVSSEEELRRISEPIELIRKKFPDVPVSVDTFRSEVARAVVERYGVAMINDVSGGTHDPLMFETVASLGVAYVLMHSRGTPQTMQTLTDYEALLPDIIHFLAKRVAQLHLLGVNDVVIDPGFGFAKTLEQNYELLRKLDYFKEIEVPILAGVSRKSMVYKLLGTSPEEALNGTTAVHMLALMGGASILRVHDVKEATEAVKVYTAWQKAGKHYRDSVR